MKCKAQFWSQGPGLAIRVRCRFNAKKDGLCGQHHPDTVKKREAKKKARWAALDKTADARSKAWDEDARRLRAYPKLLAEVKRLRLQLSQLSNNIPEKELKKLYKK